MNPAPPHRRRAAARAPRRRLALAVLVPLLAACEMWVAQPASRPAPRSSLPARIRVTRTDATSLVLSDARIQGDTLRGSWVGHGGQPVAIPVAQVARVDARRFDWVATAGVVLLVAAVAGVWGLSRAIPDT